MKLLKLIIAAIVIAAVAGVFMLSSDSAKGKAKSAASELVSSAADSAKAKAAVVADKAMDKAAETVSELVSSAADSAKAMADSVKQGVKNRVGEIRKANDVRMTKRR